MFKVIDAWEDVYYGFYQQQNRFDIAAKSLSVRMLFSIAIFAALILLTKDLLFTLVFSTISSAVFCGVILHCSFSSFRGMSLTVETGTLKDLLVSCTPMFLGAFLSFYIGNAPKYSIDAILSDELQACYGFVAMPVFVIGILNNFVFGPMLYQISLLWKKREIKKFLRYIFFQMIVLCGITLVCMIGANLIGIPVLSFLYNFNLSEYRTELLILLLGGGFLGLSGILTTMLTVIRSQRNIVWGFSIVAVIALVISDLVVEKYGMLGAAVMYTCLMALVCLFFSVFLAIGIKKEWKFLVGKNVK